MNKETTHHNCQELISRVFLALDGAMSKEEEQKFLEELNSCNCCLEKYQVERSFKEFLSLKISRKCCSESLATDIRRKIVYYKQDDPSVS